MSDEAVIGEILSPACYIKDAFPAALYLVWKYARDFSGGIIANANLGGDNCHRGAVVGSLLGAACKVPLKWRAGLRVLQGDRELEINRTSEDGMGWSQEV
jgi:ADP-ribosylglycohydrolase